MYPTNRPFIMVNPSHMMNEMPLCINIRKEGHLFMEYFLIKIISNTYNQKFV